MTTARDDPFHPITMAAARVATGPWQQQAACRDDRRFLTRPVADQLAVCGTCPVIELCRSLGFYPVETPAARRRSVFPCGHPKTADNSVKNGKRASGAQLVLCRTCREARRAA